MGLRAKLFFWIGLLFLLTAVSSYILPRLFIQEDVISLKEMFDTEVQKERSSQQETRRRLFTDRVIQDISSFNGTLLYVDKTPVVRDYLNPSTDLEQKTIWQQLSTLISYNPEIGFASVQNNNLEMSLVVDNPQIYSSQAIKLTENCNLILIKTGENIVPQITFGPFFAIHFEDAPKVSLIPPSSIFSTATKENSKDLLSKLYYFYSPSILGLSEESVKQLSELNPYLIGLPIENLENPQEAQSLMQAIKNGAESIEKAIKENGIKNISDFALWLNKQSAKPEKLKTEEKKQLSSEKRISNLKNLNKNIDPSVTNKINKLNLTENEKKDIIREYAYLYLQNITKSPLAEGMPLGGTSFSRKIEGFDATRYIGGALINKELFFENNVFDAKAYFKAHLPQQINYPIANGVALIDSYSFREYFIGNTLLIKGEDRSEDISNLLDHNPSFLTIGKTILDPIRHTSLFPDEMVVFLDLDGNIEYAIDNYSHEIPKSFFIGASFKDLINLASGKINIRNIPYHFIQLEDYELIPLRIFLLMPDALEPIYTLQKSISNALIKIYDKLSYQLLIATIALLGLALIILGFLSKKITKPIIMLANATEGIVRGNYSDITLPEVQEGQKDELTALTLSFAKMIKGLQDKERIRGMLDKVVSKEIASEILKKGAVSLGGESKIVTVLFADIRGFTKLTEYLDPQVVITNLNHYMTSMTNIIELEGGVIDKYVGDAIMALYGAPVEMPDGAMRAIKTAILMIQKLKTWNEERVKKGEPIIEIGIGINTGKVVAGNMGADTRLNYTVLGANVNLSSRLCSAANPMQIRVTKDTLEASGLKDRLDVEELEPFVYKGFSEPIIAYAIKGFKN